MRAIESSPAIRLVRLANHGTTGRVGVHPGSVRILPTVEIELPTQRTDEVQSRLRHDGKLRLNEGTHHGDSGTDQPESQRGSSDRYSTIVFTESVKGPGILGSSGISGSARIRPRFEGTGSGGLCQPFPSLSPRLNSPSRPAGPFPVVAGRRPKRNVMSDNVLRLVWCATQVGSVIKSPPGNPG